jgi:lysophospholipase
MLERTIEADLADAAIAVRRGLPDAPSGYTPAEVNCPSTRPSIRLADGLSQNEIDWTKKRRQNTLNPMKELLSRLDITGLNTTSYINSHSNDLSNIPNIGIAASGGGWRALLNAAGAVAAFDSRTANATNAGHLGGLLQSSTYLAGLSGGSWLVGSLFMNNFTTVPSLLDSVATDTASGFLWGFEESILAGPPSGGIISSIVDTVDYFTTIYDQVSNKEDQDYNTTITDYWGRALSFQLINATDGGPSYTWSSIADQPIFKNGNTPLPLIVADGRAPGEILVSLNATNYEFNPWEMGSWDPTVYGFVPTQYVGSKFEGGLLPNSSSCIAGFDSASYVLGTSSSLFNQLILNLSSMDNIPTVFKDAIAAILARLGRKEEDIADWTPNPFFGWNSNTNPNAANDSLTLVDGGEDLQNIPLTPLVQPIRAVDVIFAIDSSADTVDGSANWPNGTAMVASYERSLHDIANGTAFPAVPAQNSFVNLGLNNKPTFFGCDSSNTSAITPLIVYLPNAPYVYNSNVSTFQLEYTKAQQQAIVQNGYDVVTMGNATRDKDWPTCVGCAILQRSLERTKTAIPDVCTQCFNRYCWNGTVDNRQPSTPYAPKIILPKQAINGTKKGAASGLHVPGTFALGATAFFAYILA